MYGEEMMTYFVKKDEKIKQHGVIYTVSQVYKFKRCCSDVSFDTNVPRSRSMAIIGPFKAVL